MVRHVKSSQEDGETEARKCQKIREGTNFIDLEDEEYTENHQKKRQKIGSFDGGSSALQDGNEKALEGVVGNCFTVI